MPPAKKSTNVGDLFRQHRTTVSFEFFPPETERASDSLFRTIHDLIPLRPSYVSVTYGAGGGTRRLTHDLVLRIQKETDLTVVCHLTCVGAGRREIGAVLQRYHASGIRNIMALRGDPPGASRSWRRAPGGFTYAAELVAYIRRRFPDMGIGVAAFPEGHPQSRNRLLEMDYLKAKVEAGADFICTQLFFDNRDFFDFRERCRLAGIEVPIVAGLMPVSSRKSLLRMADLASRSRFPANLLRSLDRCQSDEQVERAGLHWTAEQVRDLLDHEVAGIHFYTLNRSGQIRRVCESLGLSHISQFQK